MEYRTLGKSSLQISTIGFGCMSLKNDYAENERILHKACSVGINFFDTADLYDKGLNEEQLGKAFREKRKEVIIATKVGNQWRKDGNGWDWNPSKNYILSSVEDSLRRLQTDYIDLYQLHGGTIDDPIDDTIEAFEILQQQGKIRYYGISSIRPNVIREYVKRSKIVSVMMQYSLLDRRPEEECLSLLLQNQIGVLARGSVAQGMLINKTPKPYLGFSEAEVNDAADAIQTLSSKERSATHTALKFVLQQPAITSAIVGIRKSEQLLEAAMTPQCPPLTDQELSELRRSIRTLVYDSHR